MEPTNPELELHQELQRLATELVDRITQAADDLERSADPDVRDEVLRKHLLYAAAAFEIATGPIARVSLLDMLVFVRLCREVLERHYIPKHYGERGRELVSAFAWGEAAVGATAERVIGPSERETIVELADHWLAENPAQVRVEGIRFADFASSASPGAAARSRRAGGLFASVKSASRTANEAILMSERGLFLVHRLPFLWRLQARVGAREIAADARTDLARDLAANRSRVAAVGRRAATLGAATLGALFAAVIAIAWVVAHGGS